MPSLIKRSNGIYYVVIAQSDGRRRWISTGKRVKSQALRAMTAGELEPQERGSGKSAQEFFHEFLDYAKTVYSEETLQVYQRAFQGFVRHLGNLRLEAVSPRHVDSFKSKRLGEVKAVTVNIELRTLRAAFYTALRWKLLAENPFKQVRLCQLQEV